MKTTLFLWMFKSEKNTDRILCRIYGMVVFLLELYETDGATVSATRGGTFKIVCMSPVEAQDSDRTTWKLNGAEMDPDQYHNIVFSRIV